MYGALEPFMEKPMRDAAYERRGVTPRIAVRAVLSGMVVELAAMSVLLALFGAFASNVPMLNADRIRGLGLGAHLGIGFTWIVGALAGGFVAARVARASSSGDGVLYGVVTWATTCLTAGLMLCIWYMSALKVGLVTPAFGEALVSPMMLRAFFVHDLLALAAAIVGASWAARVERRVSGEHVRTSAPIGRPVAEPG